MLLIFFHYCILHYQQMIEKMFYTHIHMDTHTRNGVPFNHKEYSHVICKKLNDFVGHDVKQNKA